ncbi:hypothetical protein QF008_001989 [Pseudomonas protegens]|uniref:DUF1302 domain-containing protein n=1 Tax=Pseudomonas protegens TaxID=380021 RepID=UPI000F48306D|nr:DUF1302 domain-containing protein [Pseudomonas protegens]MDT3420244.1 hypothetical protein [Pseudomonas protegens]ROM24753.1 adhesin [Pseudomonas protegens]
MAHQFQLDPFRLLGLPTLLALSISAPGQAATFDIGEIQGQFDSSLSIGASWALRNPDRAFIGTWNAGHASSQSSDDGRLNFRKGETFSKIFKGVHDLQLSYGDSGVFLRGKYWYDFELKDESRRYVQISDEHRKEAAKSSGAQLLDAFVYHNYFIADQPGNARLGKQVVSWGESTFIGNGINVINPTDVAAFRRPGAEIKEGLIPVNMLFLSQGLSENLSAEFFYQLEWDQTVVDNCGTFFGSDVMADGCNTRMGFSPPWDPNGQYHFTRGGDRDARDSGQFGMALRWQVEALNNTEFGLYALNYHSRAPFLGGTVGAAPFAVKPGTRASSAEYFIEYPEDIRLYGLSFATTLGTTAVSGELSYRPNMPLSLNGSDVTIAALAGPMAADLGAPIFTSGFAQPVPGESFHGYVRKPVTQAQITLTHFIDQVWAAERLSLITEIGYNHLGDINSNALRFGRDSIFGNGELPDNRNCALMANPVNPQNCNNKGFYTANSWGYRGRAILDYQNVIAGVNLKPSLSWSHDVQGYGPNFNQGSKAISLALDADLRNTYSASLSYTDFFGGAYNTSTDRDFVALSFGVSF